jgi:hypothetical protein
MYVACVPNRGSPPAYLLREGYRDDGKVKTRTLANLSHWPLAKIERLRRVLRDEVLSDSGQGLTMLRSLPHGHVAAALGTARKMVLSGLTPVRRLCSRTGDDVRLRSLQSAQHCHSLPEEEQSAAAGGNVLVGTRAKAKEVAEFIMSPAEPRR